MGLIRLSNTDAYNEYNDIRNSNTGDYNKWLTDSSDNDRFYDGGQQQWTAEEIEAQEDRGQYTMTMNIAKKAIDAQVGIFTSNKPKMMCLSNSKETKIADVASKLLDQVYRDSKGSVTIREIVFNAFRANMGFAHIRYDESDKVLFEKLSYRDIKVDPNSSDSMYEDADWIAVCKWVRVEKVKVMYNIQNLSTSYPYEWTSLSNTYIQNQKNEALFDETGNYIYLVEKYKKIPYRSQDGRLRTQIEKRTLIGYEYLFKEMLPADITDYPVIPMYATLSDNPFKYSDMHYLKDSQRFVNKMYNETIRSAQALSSGKVIVRTSDIPDGDIDAFANNWSLPGAVVELNPGAQDPTVVHPDALNQAYFSMYQDAVGHLTLISSLGDQAVNGNSQDYKRPNQDLHMQREMIMDNLKMPAGIFEAFMIQIGKVCLQYCQAYLTNETIIKIAGGTKILKQIETDQKRGLDASSEENIQAFIEAETKKGVPYEQVSAEVDEAVDRIKTVDAIVDIMEGHDTLCMEVSIVSDSYAPNYSASKYGMVERMVEKGAVPPELLLDYSLLPDREGIKKKVDSVKSLSQQLVQANTQMEEAGKEIKKRDEEIRQLQMKNVDVSQKAKHESIYKDERAKSYVNKQQMQMDRQKAAEEMRLALERFMMELEINKEDLKEFSIDQIQNTVLSEQIR